MMMKMASEILMLVEPNETREKDRNGREHIRRRNPNQGFKKIIPIALKAMIPMRICREVKPETMGNMYSTVTMLIPSKALIPKTRRAAVARDDKEGKKPFVFMSPYSR
jgi:hypothetical protein